MNLFQKINEVQKLVSSVVKSGEIQAGNNSYTVVTHDDVTRALHLPIAKTGIVCWPNMKSCSLSTIEKIKVWNGNEQKTEWHRADVVAEMTFINSDDPTERLTTEATAYAFDTSDKAVGKAYSMAIKMMYLKTFMLESADQEEDRPVENAVYKEKKIEQKTKPETKVEPQKNMAPISVEQKRILFETANSAGLKIHSLQNLLSDQYKVVSSGDLKVFQFDELMDKMKSPNQIMLWNKL